MRAWLGSSVPVICSGLELEDKGARAGWSRGWYGQEEEDIQTFYVHIHETGFLARKFKLGFLSPNNPLSQYT